jgi:hypothetical protein
VAYFKKADRTSVDIYATNLENLGTTENAFVDLATICEQQERICRITEEESILPTETNDKLNNHTSADHRTLDRTSYTTMPDDSAAFTRPFSIAKGISETGLQTFQDEGKDNNKRERVRNESDHLERPAKKNQRISKDATPRNVGHGTVITDALPRDDPRFLHKTASDVDIIDLPGFNEEDIDKMPQEEVEEHFNKTTWSLPRRDMVLFSAVAGQK